MKEITKNIEQKVYKCENCGAEHSYAGCFYKCFISGREICIGCAKIVCLYDIFSDDFYKEYIHPDYYKKEYEATWRDTYFNIMEYLKEEFDKKLEELDKKYAQCDDEFFRSWLPKIDEWKRNKE